MVARQTVLGLFIQIRIYRYVPNEQIPYLKLEKVIKKDLHVDTDEEKAQKMKSLIDKVQDKQIAKNREDIEKLQK